MNPLASSSLQKLKRYLMPLGHVCFLMKMTTKSTKIVEIIDSVVRVKSAKSTDWKFAWDQNAWESHEVNMVLRIHRHFASKHAAYKSLKPQIPQSGGGVSIGDFHKSRYLHEMRDPKMSERKHGSMIFSCKNHWAFYKQTCLYGTIPSKFDFKI